MKQLFLNESMKITSPGYSYLIMLSLKQMYNEMSVNLFHMFNPFTPRRTQVSPFTKISILF